MNKFNWMKKSDGCKGMWKSPESYTDHSPPPLYPATQFFLTVPWITLGKIKGVRLRRPKDADNIKNFSAKPYPPFRGSRA